MTTISIQHSLEGLFGGEMIKKLSSRLASRGGQPFPFPTLGTQIFGVSFKRVDFYIGLYFDIV